MKNLLLLFILICPMLLHAQDDKDISEKFEMKQYYLVLLKSGPNRTQDSTASAEIMQAHLAHLTKMYDENKMSLCGPLMSEGELRGICVYHIEDMEEVKRLATSDPAVKAGRLVVEVHPWYSAMGMILK